MHEAPIGDLIHDVIDSLIDNVVPDGNWILESGVWDDDGVWKDDDFWND